MSLFSHLLRLGARWQLQQPDAARAALASGAEVIENGLPKIETSDIGRDWAHWIAAHALHCEARQLIEGHVAAEPFKRTE